MGLTRRHLLTASAAAAALAVADKSMGKSRAAPRRPNILWLVSEDNNPFIGAYGDRLAHTPTIDALASKGVLYANAFSNAPVCAPSRFGIISGMYAESCAPAQQMRADARLPKFLHGFPKYLRDAGYYCTNNDKTDYNAEFNLQEMWDESSDQAHWRNRPKDAPFFAVFNFFTTHESRLFKVTEGRVKPADVRVPAYLPDVPEVRRDIASYYNLMEVMDGELAEKLAELEQAGFAEDTIVFYYSDNGGVLPRSKRYCYDEGLRCALVVHVPPKWSQLAAAMPGSIITAPVSFIDLAPTVLALASLKPPSYMPGSPFMGEGAKPKQYAFGMRDRMDERYDLVRTVRDERYRYIRNYSPHRIYAQHQAFEWQMDSYRAWETQHLAGKLNEVQKRFWHEKPAEEFYDLKSDPDQIVNLIDASAHRRRIAAMRSALDVHMLAINDNGFIPEGSPLQEYDASRRPQAYPLKRVMQLAERCIRREPRHLPALVAALDDANEVIRYWGVQGLLMLKQQALPAKETIQTCFDKEASTPVRIVLAEALAQLGEEQRAVKYLAELLDSNADMRVRLQALNALTWVGLPAKQALPAIERAVADTNADEYIRNAGGYLILVLNGRYQPSSRVYQGRGARSD